jgi:hypothetical protein
MTLFYSESNRHVTYRSLILILATRHANHSLTHSLLMSASVLSGARLIWLVNKAGWSLTTEQVSHQPIQVARISMKSQLGSLAVSYSHLFLPDHRHGMDTELDASRNVLLRTALTAGSRDGHYLDPHYCSTPSESCRSCSSRSGGMGLVVWYES